MRRLVIALFGLALAGCASSIWEPSRAELAYESRHPGDCEVIRAAIAAVGPSAHPGDDTPPPPFTWLGFTEAPAPDGEPSLASQVRFLQAPDRALYDWAFCRHDVWNANQRRPPPKGQRFLIPRFSDDGSRALVGLRTRGGWRAYLLARDGDGWRVLEWRALIPDKSPDPVVVDEVV